MNEKFREIAESLDPAFQKLKIARAYTSRTLSDDLPTAGVYLFSEGDSYLYVGRSNRLRKRIQEICRPSANHNTSPFAFRLAREATGCIEATYTTEGSRSELEKDPEFKLAFASAKVRVSRMDVRIVEETIPLRQALLQMYVSISLSTPYNDFDNH